MGALREDQAGAGSAVNDTVREVGGTLGVAVVGSVMSTVYGPSVLDALTGAGAPAGAARAAGHSIIAGLGIAGGLPGNLAAGATTAVQQSFLDGLTAGSWVCAAACAAGALVALALLPARHTRPLASADSGREPAAATG